MQLSQRFGSKSRYTNDIVSSSPLYNKSRPVISTFSPPSSKTLTKRLINKKIPTPKSIREFYTGFNVNNCKLQIKDRFDTKPNEKFKVSNEDSDCEYGNNYEEFVNTILKDVDNYDSCKTVDKEMANTSLGLLENFSESYSKKRYNSLAQPCGRFHKRSTCHSKSLLPQTKAKIRLSRPVATVRLAIDGNQRMSSYKDKPRSQYFYDNK